MGGGKLAATCGLGQLPGLDRRAVGCSGTNTKAPANDASRHDQEAVSGLYIFYSVGVNQDNLPIVKYPQMF